MQNPEGQVLSVDSSDPVKSALVRIDAQSICERCEAGRGCGAGLLGSGRGRQQVSAIVADDLEITAGDRVSIALEPQNILTAALLVYGLPLFAAVLAALLAYSFQLGDGPASLAALSGLGVGILAAKSRLGRSRCLRDFTPVVVAKMQTTGS